MNGLGSARSLLGQSVLVLFRNLLIVVILLAALAVSQLLALYLAGHCFQSVMTACVSPEIYRLLGDRALAVQYAAADLGSEISRHVLHAIALLLFFTTTVPNAPPRHAIDRRPRRTWRLIWRIIINRIVLSLVSVAFWVATKFMLIPTFGDLSSAGATIAHFGLILSGTLALSFLYAKIVFYVPAAAYDENPDTFGRCWEATRGVVRTLFLVYLPLVVMVVALNMSFWLFGRHLPGFARFTEDLAGWSGVASDVTAYIVPTFGGMILTSIVGFLMSGPVSLVAFRAARGRATQVAEIFE